MTFERKYFLLCTTEYGAAAVNAFQWSPDKGDKMGDVRDVLPMGSLAGKQVISLETGNRLGEVRDFYIDPINGLVVGVTLSGPEGGPHGLPYESIHSFGQDAVMAVSESFMRPVDELGFGKYPRAGDLIGTKIITISGNNLGSIRNVFVTLQPPPMVVYSVGESLLDRLLGRELFILASAGHAFSDDGERLVVPDDTAENGDRSLESLLNPPMSVRSYGEQIPATENYDTWVPAAAGNTGSRELEEDEFATIVHADDDETVVRLRPDLTIDGQPG
jgi:uncharacterized protein YrrD